MKKLAYLAILLTQLSLPVFAQESFVVERIKFEGLQRITSQTVENYLPIHEGQTLKPAKTAAILRSLYQTGFFDHITLSREGNTLVIDVVERPTIGQLKLSGNSVIPTDKLTSVMKTLDIAEGHIYNPLMLDKIKQGLLSQYYQLGRYNARVDITSAPMTRNRVLVKITISEGLVAKIRRISIIGNHVFDEKTLIKQLDISTTGLFSFITQSDRYSEAKLEESLEKIRSYYMDHGYIRFEIKSAQAEITPDRKAVYINIVVNEGVPYTVKNYEFRGNLILPREEYIKRMQIKPGDIFSRQKLLDSEKSITDYLGNDGYIFASISLQPEIDDKTHQVVLILNVNPGKRAYVHHVTFSDNNQTNDIVLRREIQQWEAAPASTAKLEESKHRLSLLPYIRDVQMSVNPVPNREDQVDVNYKVKEDSAAQASFKIGYSQLYRTILGAGLNQKNFMGTGNTLGINFQRSRYEQFYSVDYTNPYYTEDGISRSFNASISRVDPGAAANVNSGYTINEYDLGVTYGIPVLQEQNVFNRIIAGFSYENTLVNLDTGNPGNISTQVNTFILQHGRRFQQGDFKLGYSRDSRDKAIFPTDGSLQTLFLDFYAPLSRGSLTYYTLNYQGKWYQPLYDQFVFLTSTDLGYGSGLHGARDFPFFKNYYAGGIGSVRGYQGYTLGPRDSDFKAYGGNMFADASINLIFPNYISDNLRTSVFMDAGNVYTTVNNRSFGGQSTNSGPIRYSAGVEADWLTPFGPIALSLAQPIHRRSHDERETFQFSLGANF